MIEILMAAIIGKLFAYVFAGSFFLVLGKLAKEIGVMAIENWPSAVWQRFIKDRGHRVCALSF